MYEKKEEDKYYRLQEGLSNAERIASSINGNSNNNAASILFSAIGKTTADLTVDQAHDIVNAVFSDKTVIPPKTDLDKCLEIGHRVHEGGLFTQFDIEFLATFIGKNRDKLK